MRLTINGKEQEVSYKTTLEVREAIGDPTDIVILNGFQIDNDRSLSENDIVTIIKKGSMPREEELESMMMSRHTPHVHQQ